MLWGARQQQAQQRWCPVLALPCRNSPPSSTSWTKRQSTLPAATGRGRGGGFAARTGRQVAQLRQVPSIRGSASVENSIELQLSRTAATRQGDHSSRESIFHATATAHNSSMASVQLHSVLRVRQSGSIVQLQPFKGQDLDGDTLSIDLATGSTRLKQEVGLQRSATDAAASEWSPRAIIVLHASSSSNIHLVCC